MYKNSFLSFCSACLLIVVFTTGCRRDVEDKPVFPQADFFSPTAVVSTSDVITLVGVSLENSIITVGGQPVNIISNDGDKVTFTLASSLVTGNAYTVKVVLSDGSEKSFVGGVRFDDNGGVPTTYPSELLIADFDGGGIRSAVATVDFTNGQWSGNAGANSAIGITNENDGVESSNAGGNFAFASVGPGGVLPNTSGFVATLTTRNEIQNDGETTWPVNFFEYPGSPLEYDSVNDNAGKYFLNLYVNMNGNINSQLRIFLGNASLLKENQYAYTINSKSTTNANAFGAGKKLSKDSGWEFVSIGFNEFISGFGFTAGGNLTIDEILKVNRISIDIADDFNDVYDNCCRRASFPGETPAIADWTCCDQAITEPVSVSIDHVSITKGLPALEYTK